MTPDELALYKDPTDAAEAIVNLLERLGELEAKVTRLQRLNKLRDVEE